MSGPCILVADDDPDILEGLSLILERPGRTTILCSDLESAEVALSRYGVTHLLCDVQFSGSFGFEGLHFLAQAQRAAPGCRIVLMTGNASNALRDAALGFGAATVLTKPFGVTELEDALNVDEVQSEEPYQIIRFPTLDEILRGDGIWIAFQPIVRVAREGFAAFGFEALLRLDAPWTVGGPAMVLDYAYRRGRLAELNRATLSWGLDAAAALPSDGMLFLNIDPAAFDDRLTAVLDSRASAISLSRVVLEITERCAFPDEAVAVRVCEELSARGVRFAFDDHGSAYSHLAMIHRIRPCFLKISHCFGSGFESDPTKEPIIRHIVSLARDFSCETILEGVETASTAEALRGVGVGFAQGFYFGRPCAASHYERNVRTA